MATCGSGYHIGHEGLDHIATFHSFSLTLHIQTFACLCNVSHNYLATSTYHIISLSTKHLTSHIPHLFSFLVPVHQINYCKTNFPKVPTKNHQWFPVTYQTAFKCLSLMLKTLHKMPPNHFIISCFIASLASANPVYRLSPTHTPTVPILSLWSWIPFFCLLKFYLFFRVVVELYFFH